MFIQMTVEGGSIYPDIWMFCMNEDKQKENSYLISALGSLGYPQNPVKGKEEEKFLETAKSILASNKCSR